MPSHASGFTKFVLHYIYNQSDAVTVNSEAAARELQEGLGMDSRRVRYIPNGIDLAAWDRQSEVPCHSDCTTPVAAAAVAHDT